MKLKWLGHAAFLITAEDGTRIITDPYVPGSFDGGVGYAPIKETADAVTVSHDHEDHSGWRLLPGKPKLIQGAGSFKAGSVSVTGFDTAHDESGGSKRGRNTVYLFDIDGLKLCHLGDLGELLPDSVARALGAVDVLLCPVGGVFTLDAQQAHEVGARLQAKVVVPMHYKTPKLGFPIAGVVDFIRGRQNVKQAGSVEVEIEAGALPASPEIWVLQHAL
ncbi:MAG: MBL fold metallo-hydrolase [candidate division WOR-3 bacterium]